MFSLQLSFAIATQYCSLLTQLLLGYAVVVRQLLQQVCLCSVIASFISKIFYCNDFELFLREKLPRS